MAKPKKGALCQQLVAMVDSTDFASVESGITESDFNSGATRKFYGWNHGVSTATTSGSISKAASLVRSGVFRLTLKGTENNFDCMQVRVNKTGCAEQIIQWENVDNDDSDLMSYLVAMSGMLSDAHSAAILAASNASEAQSKAVQTYSLLSDLNSNFLSRVPKEPAARSQLSDAHSDLDATLNIVYNDFLAATTTAISLIGSPGNLGGAGATLAGNAADIYSQLSDARSDLASKIGGITVTISASDISDIASAVVAGLPVVSEISDIYSLLSDLNSNFNSRIPKEPAARSQLSDLHSDLRSYMVGLSGTISDTYSLLSDFNSNLLSRVPKEVAARSQLSDIGSDLRSYLVGMSGMLSDAHSAAILGASTASEAQSQAVKIYSLLSDLNSNFGSRVPEEPASRSQLSALVGGDISDIASAVWAHSAALALSNALSDAHSDLASKIGAGGGGATTSAIADKVWSQFGSMVGTGVSNVFSYLSDIASNLNSRVTKEVAYKSQLSDIGSDLKSYLVGMSGMLSDAHSAAILAASNASEAQSNAVKTYSLLSDLNSNFLSRIPKEPAARSQLSDVHSDLRSYLTGMSDALSDAHSDLASKMGNISVAIAGSDINAIASAIVSALPVTAEISNIYSLLSDLNSNFLSRVPKETAARSQLSDIGSDLRSYMVGMSGMLSDVHSAATAGSSRALLNQSAISNTFALLSDFNSNFLSRVPKEPAARSQLSDIGSDLRSYMVGLSGAISDVESAIDAGTTFTLDASALSSIASAVWARAGSDPTTVPAVSASMGAKVDWLTAMSRNKIIQTDSLQSVRNDGDADNIGSAAITRDATSLIRGEFAQS